MAVKWKPDGVQWSGERFGQGHRIPIKHPIAGVPRVELEELANQTWLETDRRQRKKRGKAIIEIARRDKLQRKRQKAN